MFHNWLEGGAAFYPRGGRRLAAVPAITFLRARGEPPEKMAVQAALELIPLLIELKALSFASPRVFTGKPLHTFPDALQAGSGRCLRLLPFDPAGGVSPEAFSAETSRPLRSSPRHHRPPSNLAAIPAAATLFMNENLIVLAILGLFFAGIIKGATGIGYSSCALPFLAAALDIKAAIVLLVVPAMASNAAVLFTTGSLAAALKRFWPLYIATLPGIFAGAALLAVVDKRIPTQILGIIISAYSIQAWLKPSFTLQPGFARAAPSSGWAYQWAAHGAHGIAGYAAHALHDGA